ncbi:MAG: putative rane protein [Firmicutes bacterium]|nr:putative rane protein [Bacillota bacterium]
MNYFLALVLIGLVILVHEFGHFLAARLVSIPIKVFAIGFGPALWKRNFGETEFRISLFPIGGYVLPKIENEEEFFAIEPVKRMIMTAGGPVASAIMPLCCFMILNGYWFGFSVDSLLVKAVTQTYTITYKMLLSLPLVFTHPEQLSGIIGMVQQGGEYVGLNALNALQFSAIISLNLFILNLLPIPILDGGKMLLYLSEKLHPSLARLQFPLAVAGWTLVLGLMVFTVIVDIKKCMG